MYIMTCVLYLVILILITDQIPVIQTCAVGMACARCDNQNIVVIRNGQVISTSVNRIIKARFLKGAAKPPPEEEEGEDPPPAEKEKDSPPQDVCCPNCQPIIGDANVINPGEETATCSITCDHSQNNQNAVNLAAVGNMRLGTPTQGNNNFLLNRLLTSGLFFDSIINEDETLKNTTVVASDFENN